VLHNHRVNNHDEGEGGLETLGISLVENGELDAMISCDGDQGLGLPLAEDFPESEPAENTVDDPKRDLFSAYTKEVNRFALLSPEEERELIKIAKGSDEAEASEAREKLINCNLRLVIKIASGFHKYWMNNLTDLVQEGNLGLMHAIRKFDLDKGVKLSYYASFWIRAYILKFIMENWKLVKIGTTQAQRKLFYNLKREKEKLKALGFEPSSDLLAEVIGVSPAEVEEMDQRLGGWDLSLDAPLRENSDENHINFVPSFDPQVVEALADAEEKKLLHKHLDEFRRELNNKEASILELRLLADDPLTLDEIGRRHEISRERIRQIEERLIKKIGNFLTIKSVGEERRLGQTVRQTRGSIRKSSLSRVRKKETEDSIDPFAIKWIEPDLISRDPESKIMEQEERSTGKSDKRPEKKSVAAASVADAVPESQVFEMQSSASEVMPRPESAQTASCAANCPFSKLKPFVELIVDLSQAFKKCIDKIDPAK
jgi:RNA polymerase sigma-32 factor